ncbi:MAG: hypothetical protein EBZ47_01950 [Chlamydiae bacterium]|nr:hypothetical protein [Chlamydiota bacterium]
MWQMQVKSDGKCLFLLSYRKISYLFSFANLVNIHELTLKRYFQKKEKTLYLLKVFIFLNGDFMKPINALLLTAGITSFSTLLVADSGYAVSTPQAPTFRPGEKIKENQLPAGYAKAASYQLKDSWDIYGTVDYIYWEWLQSAASNISLPASGILSSALGGTNVPAITSGYASGFQLGMGFNMKGMDNWNFYTQYTYYKNSGSRKVYVDLSQGNPGISGYLDASGYVNIQWDNLDVLVSRPFYFGTRLLANFTTGIKALWISNENNTSGYVDYIYTLNGNNSYIKGDYSRNLNLSSWNLGPKFGFESNWLLGMGFKAISNIAVSLMYSQSNGSNNSTFVGEIDNSASAAATKVSNPKNWCEDIKSLVPMVEAYMGIGWGSYLMNDEYHVDLSAGYDFTAIRLTRATADFRNINLMGLNIRFRFDF